MRSAANRRRGGRASGRARETGGSTRKALNLALQGGGSHGAFAWGVLDRLLEDGRIDVEGIVGTSAGAMNGVVLAHGLATGGRDGAREALRGFWSSVVAAGAWSPMQPSWLDRLRGPGHMDLSPGRYLMEGLLRMMSPYELNPANLHPLRGILSRQVDFERLRASGLKVHVCATNVLTNQVRVFGPDALSVDAVLASACLPTLFQAVEIDGEHYWDGGYLGNPPLFPLFEHSRSRDLLLVLINPIRIAEVPRTAQAIIDRINTVSFNSSLMREMRAIEFVNRIVDKGFDDDGRLKKVLLHCIDAEAELEPLGAASKMNVTREFVDWLHGQGRAKAGAFLDAHFETIGRDSSTSVQERFF